MQVEDKLRALELVLPEAAKVPPGFEFSFAWTRVRGNRIYLSGHGPLAPDGTFVGSVGKVPSEVSRPSDGLAYGLRDGQCGPRLSPDHQRHQRLLGPHP
jgi:hypothetical protein